MKKNLLTVVLLTLLSTFAFAQVSLGIRAGANLSNQKADESGDAKLGLFGGAYITGNLSESLAIQPEVYFSSMGAKDSDNSDNKIVLGYINIPLLLRFNFNEMVNVHLGPQFGILASAKAKNDDASIDVKNYYKDLDVGGVVGVGLDLGPFNAGLRYYQGFTDVWDGTGILASDKKLTNSALQLFVGYRLIGGD
jgi:hypothetical protein